MVTMIVSGIIIRIPDLAKTSQLCCEMVERLGDHRRVRNTKKEQDDAKLGKGTGAAGR